MPALEGDTRSVYEEECAGCNSEGALYTFPRLDLPDAAHKAAEKAGKAPDMLYCSELLEGTGIVAIPGSGFKQQARPSSIVSHQ